MARFSDLLGGDGDGDADGDQANAAAPDDATRRLPVDDSSDHLDRLAGMAAALASDEPSGPDASPADTGAPAPDEPITAQVVTDDAGPGSQIRLDDLTPVVDDLLPTRKGRR